MDLCGPSCSCNLTIAGVGMAISLMHAACERLLNLVVRDQNICQTLPLAQTLLCTEIPPGHERQINLRNPTSKAIQTAADSENR